jgi:hypothetical protein
MRYRQIHLDFHTSEKIKNIGSKFSKVQFQNALKIGHVDSITVFSKCHHGWAYHPSVANEMHPNLSFDLLKAQIEAAHEIDVKTPVYLSAGLDEKMARRHPEWLVRNKDESTPWTKDFAQPGYHKFCFNSPYLDYLLAQIDEVVKNYDADGIFLDIVNVQPCYCQNCVNTILADGKDPYNEQNIIELAEKVYANYTKRVRQTIDQTKPNLPVFHNGGHIIRGRRDLANMNTHIELESLPTGGWGYDHLPLSAAYARNLGMQFLGMTGKFHKSWGEFGGFKHPNALRYEVALNAANGAKNSVGDQLHPNGEMEIATYKLIGEGYREIEEIENWLDDTKNIADVALLSTEAVQTAYSTGQMAKTGENDTGAVRMLLEGKYLFDVVDTLVDFNKYKVVILPDVILISDELQAKLNEFCKNGGKILATGKSGLNISEKEFAIDFGIQYVGENKFRPSYFRPNFELDFLGNSAFVMYGEGQEIKITNGNELGIRENSYFNRTTFEFSSHAHTPNDSSNTSVGMVEGKDGIYISWSVFADYAVNGSIILREMVKFALDKLLLDNKTLSTSLPAQGVVTLTSQEKANRQIVHLLYASPVKRGQNVEIIEDIIPIYNTKVVSKAQTNPKKIYLAPQMKEIAFSHTNGKVEFCVEKIECSQLIVLEF